MARRPSLKTPRRGEVHLVSLDPTFGAEIRKTRPALIVQNDHANRSSPITIVAAMTSRFDAEIYPTEVKVSPPEGGLTAESVILLNQIRSVDRRRLVKRLGKVSRQTMDRVDRAIQISLGLVEI